MSLRSRLLAGMALVAALLVVVGTIITLTTREQLIGQVDDRLAQTARDFDRPTDGFTAPPTQPLDPALDGTASEGAASDKGDEPWHQERLSDLYEGVISDGVLTAVYTPNVGGSGIDGSQFPVKKLPDRVGEVEYFDAAGNKNDAYRVRAVLLADGRWAIAALPLHDVNETIARLVILQAGAMLAVLGVLGAVTFWVVRLGIRPVKDMTTAASQIAAGDLAVRLPEATAGTEAGALANALNKMLGRIETAVDERAQSEDRLRRFVADASHELRTPVTTIRGYAELYRYGGLRGEGELDDAMTRTEAEALRMGRLVEDMLTLAKLDEERPLDRTTVDVAGIAADAVADARAVAPERSIELDAVAASVVGDEDRLRQVLANVVGNALVHTDDATITVRCRPVAEDEVVLEVIDDGHGMEPEDAARITERFFRADKSRSRKRGGSGLGLAIVDSVIRAHGGSVEIDSAPEQGTTVRLRLPNPVSTPS